MMVSFNQVLMLSAVLFLLGGICLVARRNLIMMLLGLEIMLNAANIAFVGASLRWQDMEGHALVVFVMAVAAAEVSIGLVMIVNIYKRYGSIDPEAAWTRLEDRDGERS